MLRSVLLTCFLLAVLTASSVSAATRWSKQDIKTQGDFFDPSLIEIIENMSSSELKEFETKRFAQLAERMRKLVNATIDVPKHPEIQEMMNDVDKRKFSHLNDLFNEWWNVYEAAEILSKKKAITTVSNNV